MGMDVFLRVENQGTLFPDEYYTMDFLPGKQHLLSRSFCNFNNRRHSIDKGVPELEQIGEITGIDIQPVYDMNGWGDEAGDELEFRLHQCDTENERQDVVKEFDQRKEKLRGNIDAVLKTVTNIIEKLSTIDNLSEMLNGNVPRFREHDEYFSDFIKDKGNGYIGNNLGQDFRNFKRFLEYAKDKGATTVYFQYG